MTKKELMILRDMHNEYLECMDFNSNLIKVSSVTSDEYKKCVKAFNETYEKLKLLEEIASRMNITL